MANKDCGLMTMAFGGRHFTDQAMALAASLRLHCPDLPLALITESRDPELARLFDHIIPLKREYGSGLMQKMHLDLYSPFEETLFIDSDCLVVRDLTPLLDRYYRGAPFSVLCETSRRRGSQDEWVFVDRVLDLYGIDELPKFNGGTYYWKRGAASRDLFDAVRAKIPDWPKLSVGGPTDRNVNEEIMFGVALAERGMRGFVDGGETMRTPAGIDGALDVDVLAGVARFCKYGVQVQPAIVHFAGDFVRLRTYRHQSMRAMQQWRNPTMSVAEVDRRVNRAMPLLDLKFAATSLLRGARRYARRARRLVARLYGPRSRRAAVG
jgi:hypothetical protein